MKTYLQTFWCGLLLVLAPALASAETSFIDKIFPPLPKPGENIISGIFVVSEVSGTAECIADGKIWDLTKGERVLARGAMVRTKDKSHVTLLFSNQTAVYLEAKTSLKVEKFDQEPFQPNNDLLHEPSSSQLLVYVQNGSVVIATPQLYSGTHLLFETQHCVCAILNGQVGTEKAFMEVSDIQTHFGVIQGLGRINTRNANGDFDYLSHYIPANNQAFVKYTQNGSSSDKSVAISAGGGEVPVTTEEAAAATRPAGIPAGIRVPQDSFYVAKTGGEVECTVKNRSFLLKEGDILIARGAIVSTQLNSSATLLFSNNTVLALSEKSEVKVDKYDQEAFSPNNNLDIEPSNSQTLILVHFGNLEVTTPQLLSGTSLVFESAHGTVNLLNNQRGGDKAYLTVNAKQTTVQMANGLAGLAPRNPDGTLKPISTPLPPGPIAVIKPAVGAAPTIDAAFDHPAAPAPAIAPGNFSVASVSGELDCLANGKATVLHAGDSVPGAGAALRTAAGAKAVLTLSNQSVLTLGAKTGLKIEQLDQDSSAAAGSPLAEPAASHVRVVIAAGAVDAETPELRPTSSLILETPHTSVAILGGTAGGQKVSLDVQPKFTHVDVATGKARVSPRGLDGQFVGVADATELQPGQQATVQPTLDGRTAIAAINTIPAEAVATAPADAVTEPGQALVLQVSGLAQWHGSEGSPTAVLAVGDKLPVGAEIVTAGEAQVYLQTFVGAVANIQPNSDVVVERIDSLTAGTTVYGRTSVLNLKKGTLVSMIDPAKRNINHYSIRTPKGLAQAKGTSFAVTVGDTDMSVAATADTVTFTTPTGATYAVTAGNVTITPPGGEPQPPIPLAQAVAANPAFSGVVQTALNTVSNIVQNNIGSLPANSAANLLSQVVGVASAAVPAQAAAFTSQAVTAATSPNSSTASNAAAAVGALTAAAVTAAPGQSSQVAVAASQAAPNMTVAAVAAAAQAAPTQAASIASAVVQSNAAANPQASALSSAQSAAVIAAAATAGAPAQASAVAASVMQTTLASNPTQSSANLTQAATLLASAVSNAAPAQAGSVATALLNVVSTSSAATTAGTTQLAAAINTASAIGASTATSATASGTGTGGTQPTSVTVNQNGNGNGNNGNGNGNGGSNTAAANGGGNGNGNGNNGNGNGNGGSNTAAANGNGNGNNGNGNGNGGTNQATSITVNAVTGGPGGVSSTTTTTSTTTVSNAPTSVTVNALTGGQQAQIATGLQAATNAQSQTQFTAGATTGDPPQSNPTTPTTPPNNNVVSTAR
jgi:hypothetical protein